jgi:hypothetical protein
LKPEARKPVTGGGAPAIKTGKNRYESSNLRLSRLDNLFANRMVMVNKNTPSMFQWFKKNNTWL